MRRILAFILSMLLCLNLWSCGSVNPFSSRPFVVVVLAPAQDTAGVLRGAQFAMEQYNSHYSEFSKNKISFVIIPVILEGFTKIEVTQALQKAVHEYNAHLVIGGLYSEQALAIAEVAREMEIPFISPVAASSAVGEASHYSFSNAPSVSFQVEAAVHFMLEDLHVDTLGVLYNAYTDLSVERSESLNRIFRSFGGNELLAQSFLGAANFLSSATSLVAKEPDAIFLTAFEPNLVEQMLVLKNLGYKGSVLTFSAQYVYSHTEEFQDIGLPIFVVTAWLPEYQSVKNQEFVRSFVAEFGIMPTVNDAMIYDAFQRLFTSVKYLGSISRHGVQEALYMTKDMEGVGGQYFYTPTKTLQPMWIVEVNKAGRLLRMSLDSK